MPGPQTKEEEVNDASLLAAVMEPKATVEADDCLEGMKAEMFGVDNTSDQCHSDIHREEEEVEALPDAYYGLLSSSSSSRVLPQGCMNYYQRRY